VRDAVFLLMTASAYVRTAVNLLVASVAQELTL